MCFSQKPQNTQKMDFDELTFKVRGIIFDVFKALGPGLLESVYEAALIYEFNMAGFKVRSQVPIPVQYKSVKLDLGFKLDILIEDCIILEIKSVEALHDVHKKQLLNYLKLTGKTVGFLINFNTVYLKDKESLIRIVNNY